MSLILNPPYCYADLHFHSTMSDGILTPKELAKKLNILKVKVASLTDHDTFSGIDEFEENFKGQTISGVELSVIFKDSDVHILAYNFDTENPELLERIEHYKRVRKTRITKICKKLNYLGLDISPDEIKKENKAESFGRPHIARKMYELGYVSSVQDAFNRYLGENQAAYVPKAKMELNEAITLIHKAGGIAVLAHPGLYNDKSILDNILGYDLDGIELFHPQHTRVTRELILEKTKDKELIYTGGSDFHGAWDGRDNLALFGLDFDQWLPLKHYLNKKG